MKKLEDESLCREASHGTDYTVSLAIVPTSNSGNQKIQHLQKRNAEYQALTVHLTLRILLQGQGKGYIKP